MLDFSLPATCNDFVPFDWGAIAASINPALTDGVTGYLVFTQDNLGGPNSPANLFSMFGDAAIIQGDWESAAFVPVVPLNDTADTGTTASYTDNVHYGPGHIPSQVSPLVAGMQLDDGSGNVNETVQWNMRYFLGDLHARIEHAVRDLAGHRQQQARRAYPHV